MAKLTAPAAVLLLTLGGCANAPLLDVVTPKTKVNNPTHTTAAGLLEIVTFDAYADAGNVHILAGGKAEKSDKKLTLRYFFSDDGGQSWSQPVTVNKNLPTTIATHGNDVQLATHGKYLLALWQSKGELPGMGPLNTALSTDGGNTWKAGVNPAVNNQGDQSHADILADTEGNFHSVWLEDPEENGYQSLRYARLNNTDTAWSKPATLDDSTCSCCWNTLALSADNTLNLLYRDMKPRDMALLTSADTGNTWQNRGHVGKFGWQFDGCPHTGGGLTAVPGEPGQLHSLVWTGTPDKAGLYYLRSTDQGLHWTVPHPMGNNAIHADIAALDTNRIAAVWDEMKADGSRIYLSRSDDGGKQWHAPIPLGENNAAASHPRVLPLTDGFIVLWTEKASGRPMQLAWRTVKNR